MSGCVIDCRHQAGLKQHVDHPVVSQCVYTLRQVVSGCVIDCRHQAGLKQHVDHPVVSQCVYTLRQVVSGCVIARVSPHRQVSQSVRI